jgi:hypothetical protein
VDRPEGGHREARRSFAAYGGCPRAQFNAAAGTLALMSPTNVRPPSSSSSPARKKWHPAKVLEHLHASHLVQGGIVEAEDRHGELFDVPVGNHPDHDEVILLEDHPVVGRDRLTPLCDRWRPPARESLRKVGSRGLQAGAEGRHGARLLALSELANQILHVGRDRKPQTGGRVGPFARSSREVGRPES